MAKEKNKPVAVRFDLKLMETLKEEEKIETPQQALNFLAHFWENNRPAKADFAEGLKDAKTATSQVTSKASKAVSKPAEPKKKEGESGAHPSGLSGIDLAIWKAEQKAKHTDGD